MNLSEFCVPDGPAPGAPMSLSPEPLSDTDLRITALNLAVNAVSSDSGPAIVLDTAKKFHAWLTGGGS